MQKALNLIWYHALFLFSTYKQISLTECILSFHTSKSLIKAVYFGYAFRCLPFIMVFSLWSFSAISCLPLWIGIADGVLMAKLMIQWLSHLYCRTDNDLPRTVLLLKFIKLLDLSEPRKWWHRLQLSGDIGIWLSIKNVNVHDAKLCTCIDSSSNW